MGCCRLYRSLKLFVRFLIALCLMTAVTLMGIAIEKNCLRLKRQISGQHAELQKLEERESQLVLQTQQLGAPPRLLREWGNGRVVR